VAGQAPAAPAPEQRLHAVNQRRYDGQAEHTHGEDTEVEAGDARLVSVGVLGDGGQDGQGKNVVLKNKWHTRQSDNKIQSCLRFQEKRIGRSYANIASNEQRWIKAA
ncbi:MAG: hypothetical protein ING36_09690, partial [Burkholderiales bacterium]|nr:hypothetical protein [Burkholderiales bacterium]